MNIESHTVAWLWKETVNRLDSLAREVREAKNVMEAANFARWLQFSGIFQIFKDNPSSKAYLEVNANVVEKKTRDLIYECGELFRGGKADPKYAASDIAEINRKLDDLIRVAVFKPLASTSQNAGTNSPALKFGQRAVLVEHLTE